MTDNSASTLLPFIDDISEPFFSGCKEGVLRVQQCPDTQRLIFPPRPGNPFSPRTRAVWTEVPATGTIWSFIEPHPPLMLDFTDKAPYTVIGITLDIDPNIRLIGNLLKTEDGDIDDYCYEELEIGTPVQAIFRQVSDDITLPFWIKR